MPEITTESEKALDYGYRWFEYHAQQRISAFNMYIIVYSGVCAATSYFIKEKMQAGPIVLSVVMMLLSLLFWQLDVRGRQLVGIGERIISESWREAGLSSSLNPVTLANAPHSEGLRFKQLFGSV